MGAVMAGATARATGIEVAIATGTALPVMAEGVMADMVVDPAVDLAAMVAITATVAPS